VEAPWSWHWLVHLAEACGDHVVLLHANDEGDYLDRLRKPFATPLAAHTSLGDSLAPLQVGALFPPKDLIDSLDREARIPSMFGWLHPQGPPSGETQYLHPHLWQSPVQRAVPVAKANRTLTAADLCSRAMYAARAIGRADAK